MDRRAYAVVLSKLGKHAIALALLEAAAQHASSQTPPDAALLAAVRLSRGAAYRRAGQPARALADLEAARRYFERPRNERFLQKIFEESAETHRAMGNWQAAYAAQAERMATQDTIATQTLDQRSTRLRVQFHAEQARTRNAELEHRNTVQQLELERNGQVRRWQFAALAATDCADLPAGLVPAMSIGVAEYRPSNDSLELLLQRADEALYRAKEGGRNRVELATA